MNTPSEYQNMEQMETGQFFIGVGGCGSNLVDSILLRREMEADGGSSPKRRWEQILAGQGMIHSHLHELANTRYFSEIKTGVAEEIAGKYLFGPGDGAGHDWQLGRELFRNHLDPASSWNDAWGDDLHLSSLQDSQSIWLLHSACGGTGAGATPELARVLQNQLEELNDGVHNTTPIVSFPVFDQMSEEAVDPQQIGSLLGLTRLSSQTQAIIPLANDRIDQTEIGCKINGIEEWIPMYDQVNETIVQFLELLGGAFITEPGLGGQGFGHEIDITDIYRPIEQYHPATENLPAPILAPAIAKSPPRETWDNNDFEFLIERLNTGKLIDFDKSTARGGVFVFCSPSEEMEGLNQIIDQEAHHILNESIDFRGEHQPVHIHQTFFEGLDSVYLLALFWNPTVSRFNKLVDLAREYKHHDSVIGEEIDEHLEQIEDIVQPDI